MYQYIRWLHQGGIAYNGGNRLLTALCTKLHWPTWWKFGNTQQVLQVGPKVTSNIFQCPLIMTSTKTFMAREDTQLPVLVNFRNELKKYKMEKCWDLQTSHPQEKNTLCSNHEEKQNKRMKTKVGPWHSNPSTHGELSDVLPNQMP